MKGGTRMPKTKKRGITLTFTKQVDRDREVTGHYEGEFGPDEYAEYFTDVLHKEEGVDYWSVKAFIEDNWDALAEVLEEDDGFADWLGFEYYSGLFDSEIEWEDQEEEE